MYFVNVITTRELNGNETHEIMWGVGSKVKERTDESGFLDAMDVAQHFLHKLEESGCSVIKVEHTQYTAGSVDFADTWFVKNNRLHW